MRSEGKGVCAKTENRTFARGGGGCLQSEQVRTRGAEGSENHPIYANVIIEWSIPGLVNNVCIETLPSCEGSGSSN